MPEDLLLQFRAHLLDGLPALMGFPLQVSMKSLDLLHALADLGPQIRLQAAGFPVLLSKKSLSMPYRLIDSGLSVLYLHPQAADGVRPGTAGILALQLEHFLKFQGLLSALSG